MQIRVIETGYVIGVHEDVAKVLLERGDYEVVDPTPEPKPTKPSKRRKK